MSESDGDFLRRAGTNPDVWAAEFARMCGMDRVACNPYDGRPGTFVHSWFVNAMAAARTIWADDTTDSPHHAATDLRIAEAALRTLWRRHRDTRT